MGNELSRLHSLLDGNINYDSKFDLGPDTSSIGSLWRCSDSHDSGIGHSPPYDSGDGGNLHSGAIWNELGKVLGGMDSPIDRHSPAILNAAISKPNHDSRSSFMDLTPRSASIDLGIPMGNNSSSSSTNQGINNMVESQTNSLPFTLNGLINASLSSSLSTLSISRSDNSSALLLEGLAGHSMSRHSTSSPADQVTDSTAFSSGSE